ncbi:MAG: PAS domain S-box protein, partial [Anaerolineales bacterium]|nr:PAS domain S-box protein [Anaerolineales bacterium]
MVFNIKDLHAKILLVDDEYSIRTTLGEFLKDADYEVDLAENAEQALDMLSMKDFDLVVTDIIMPRTTGVELLKAIRETAPEVLVIMMTGEPTVETASEAVRSGASDYLTKPIDKNQLLKVVASTVKLKTLDDERRRLVEENRHYQKNLEVLVEQRTEDLTLINTINNAVNRGVELSALLKLLAEEVKRVFNSKSTTVYLYNQEQKYLEMPYIALGPEVVEQIEKHIGTTLPAVRIPVEEGSLAEELLHSDGPCLINDAETIQKWMLEFTRSNNLSEKSRLIIRNLILQNFKLEDIQSLVAIPMISAGEVIGLMDFSWNEPFTEEDVKRVAGVTGQVTAAIASLRAEKEKDRSRSLMLNLSQAVQAVQIASNAEEIYSAIGEQVARMDIDVTAFVLSDDKMNLAVAYHSLKSAMVRTIEKLTNLSEENYSFPLNPEGYYHKIITSRETVFTHLELEPFEEALPQLLHPIAKQIYGLLGKQQSIIAPLVVRGEVHGLLSFSAYDLSESDVPAITTFANQAAISLEKIQLFRETQELAVFNESIVHNMAEGIVLEDVEGVITFVNPAAADMLGYTSEEWVGMQVKEIIPPDQHSLLRAAVERRARGESDSYELDLIDKDGQQISVLLSGSPRFDDEGHFEGTIGVFTDITERKREKENILRYSRIFEDSLNEIYLFEKDTLKFTQVNSAGQNNLGYTMEELGELTPIDLKPGITAKSFAKLIEPLRKGESERIV